jgi:hypothetical protein
MQLLFAIVLKNPFYLRNKQKSYFYLLVERLMGDHRKFNLNPSMIILGWTTLTVQLATLDGTKSFMARGKSIKKQM